MTENRPSSADPAKAQFLLTHYQSCWQEMSWRRQAGYRTIILGLGYCAALLVVITFNHTMPPATRYCLAGVIFIATLFGSLYLASNYRKYMQAAGRIVAIEDFFGAFEPNFLGGSGPLNPAARRDWPKTPLSRDMVSFWSILAFAVGGLLTAAAVVLV